MNLPNVPDLPLSCLDEITLNGAARATSAATDAALSLVSLALEASAEGRTISPGELRPLADRANDSAQRAHRLLLGAGANDADLPPPLPIPLHLLDTPDTRELLGLLERAQAVAERVDAARARSLPADVPLLPGESRGTDLAESVSLLALRLHTEVHGPAGRE